jgi:CBS domain containing-hemolysin-like protein
MNRAKPSIFRIAALVATVLATSNARASFLAGDALDAVADFLALFVLIVVPIAGIVVFWLVHILPEKIAEQRHHPQKTAINTLCLLSLVFGGMLWPFAWLWAFSRPVQFRMAYGTDKHEDYYREMAHKARSGEVARDEILRLKGELDDVAARRMLSADLMKVREEFEAVLAGAAQASEKGR